MKWKKKAKTRHDFTSAHVKLKKTSMSETRVRKLFPLLCVAGCFRREIEKKLKTPNERAKRVACERSVERAKLKLAPEVKKTTHFFHKATSL